MAKKPQPPLKNVLVIDDEASIRRSLKEVLEYEQFNVEEAEDGKKGFDMIKEREYDLILCDIKMPKMDGMELLPKALKVNPDIPIIMISGHGTEKTSFEATKKGAYDYIAKPLDLNKLLVTIRNALDKSELITETKVLKRKTSKTREIIGKSPAIEKIKETIERIAGTDAKVLITGENGTGKELVARWIYEKSNRSDMPFVEVNCAAIPTELIESELFGHEKGAFTSAISQRIGKFEQAHEGTLFLDEIGDMSLSAQAKVLRALQENKITRVGGNKDINVDVRVIAATNKNLVEEIEKNNFRLDLYHRLSVLLLHVPSLNEHKEDIPLLAERFVQEVCEEHTISKKVFTPKALQEFQKIKWTGNIRELRNVVERLVILCDEKITEKEVVMYAVPGGSQAGIQLDELNTLFKKFKKFQDFKDFMEKKFVEYKLAKNDWSVSKTAVELDIQRSHLYNKIEKYDLERS